MRPLASLGHGLSDLRAHPGRAALSGLSLCVGVLAVVAIFTIGEVTEEVFVSTEEQRTGRLVTVTATIEVDGTDPAALRAMLEAAGPVTATGGAAALTAHPAGLTGAGIPTDVTRRLPLEVQSVTLVAGDLAGVRRLPLLDGEWFDSTADLPVAIVGNLSAARRWGGVGSELMVSVSARQPPVPAVVVGVIADGQSDPVVYLPLPALLHAQPYALDLTDIELLLHHPTAGPDALTAVAEQVAAAGGGTLAGQPLRVDTVGLLLDQLRTQQTAFLVVAVVALAIAALGMLNIGLASVGERARELVIRRAIGATRSDILNQMIISALAVAILAAAVATAAAWAGVQWWVPLRIHPASAIEAPGLPWLAVGWGLVAAVVTTVIGSVVPAIVAARLDVATPSGTDPFALRGAAPVPPGAGSAALRDRRNSTKILTEDVGYEGCCSDQWPAPRRWAPDEGTTMKYMIMMFGGVGESLADRSPEWITRMQTTMMTMDRELRESGEVVDSKHLMDPSQATTVRLARGAPTPTDGPFAEIKESLAGYWIVETTKERAIEIASQVVAVVEYPMEVRGIMDESAPPER